MIRFATLFLGLVFGALHVELDVAEEVRSARLFVDGQEVATLHAPWEASVDLGPSLSPHELVAVAVDANGREVDRTRQWINRPRAVAEAGFVLEPGAGGRGRIARLGWECLLCEAPRSAQVTFDGRPLAAPDPRHIVLPPHEPGQVHFLRAEVDFGDGISAVADAVFGGARRADTISELTAVPVLLERGRKLPPADGLGGWLARRGEPLQVVAVDEGPAEVLFVLAGGAHGELERMEKGRTFAAPGERFAAGQWDGDLGSDHTFRFGWSVPESQARFRDDVHAFTCSEDFRARDGGVLWVGARLASPARRGGERIAEAVATFGLTAARRDRRRAVVLLVGPSPVEASPLPAAEAARFLERLRVPFLVWSVAETPSPVAGRFGAVTDASTRGRFEAAVASLSKLLDRQRVVWVEGTFLPHEIEPTARASGLTMAR